MPTGPKTLTAVNDELRSGGAEQWTKVGIQLTGAPTGMTVQFESSIDGVNWVATAAIPAGGGAAVTSTAAAGVWVADITGLTYFRVRVSATTSGSFVATLQPSVG